MQSDRATTYRERATELLAIAAQKFAFPGGYPLYAVMEDGEAFCCDCCGKEAERIAEAYPRDGWRIAAVDVYWEGEPMPCAHCGEPIESAYGPVEGGAS